MEETCIFCKIAADKIPSTKVYEDESVLAFLDIHPKAPGHTLLIPKTHYPWFYELPDAEYQHLFAVAKTLTPELKKKYEAKLVKLSIVGDEVPHAHVHLIPFPANTAPQI